MVTSVGINMVIILKKRWLCNLCDITEKLNSIDFPSCCRMTVLNLKKSAKKVKIAHIIMRYESLEVFLYQIK